MQEINEEEEDETEVGGSESYDANSKDENIDNDSINRPVSNYEKLAPLCSISEISLHDNSRE